MQRQVIKFHAERNVQDSFFENMKKCLVGFSTEPTQTPTNRFSLIATFIQKHKDKNEGGCRSDCRTVAQVDSEQEPPLPPPPHQRGPATAYIDFIADATTMAGPVGICLILVCTSPDPERSRPGPRPPLPADPTAVSH